MFLKLHDGNLIPRAEGPVWIRRTLVRGEKGLMPTTPCAIFLISPGTGEPLFACWENVCELMRMHEFPQGGKGCLPGSVSNKEMASGTGGGFSTVVLIWIGPLCTCTLSSQSPQSIQASINLENSSIFPDGSEKRGCCCGFFLLLLSVVLDTWNILRPYVQPRFV